MSVTYEKSSKIPKYEDVCLLNRAIQYLHFEAGLSRLEVYRILHCTKGQMDAAMHGPRIDFSRPSRRSGM